MTSTLYSNLHSTKHAGKIALVTGGSTGIGRATAKRLAREGATVIITGRRQAQLDAAVEDIGHGARAVRGDISSAADVARIVDDVSSAHGRIDILFANAGGGEFAPSFAADLKGRGIRINVVAPGTVVTPAYKTELRMSDAQIEAHRQEIADKAPLGRVGEGDEIAKAVSFLASDDASYITGIELFVDGGLVQV